MEHETLFLKKLKEILKPNVYWKDVKGIYQWCSESQVIAFGLTSEKDVIGKTDFDLPWKNQASVFQFNDKKRGGEWQGLVYREVGLAVLYGK